MGIMEKQRTLRPSSRKEISKSYKVDTRSILVDDILVLKIFHESDEKNPLGIYEFDGKDIAGKASIHFSAIKVDNAWKISFSGAYPKTHYLCAI